MPIKDIMLAALRRAREHWLARAELRHHAGFDHRQRQEFGLPPRHERDFYPRRPDWF